MARFEVIGLAWSIVISVVLAATVLEPTTCRPALPVDWFIRKAQNSPCFSEALSHSLQIASANLSAIVDLMPSKKVDAVSVVVAGPWGRVVEHHVGKLRSNDSCDDRTVDGDSIYRIASISKVIFSPVYTSDPNFDVQVLTVLELLILQSAGKLSLDDSPIKYIPCLKISKEITLEMLGSQ